MGIPPFLKGQRCNGPSCSTWSRAFAVTSGFPTHCTTSISSSALYSFCVFRFLHCIRGFSLLGFGLCEYSLCNRGHQGSHRCYHIVICSQLQVIVPTFWQVQVQQSSYSTTFCHFCIHQKEQTQTCVRLVAQHLPSSL